MSDDVATEYATEPPLDEPPKKRHGGSGPKKWDGDQRGLHLRALNQWTHRCFLMKPKKFNGQPSWWVTNGFPALVPDTPQSFYWTARDDRDGLRSYIDSLVLGQRSKSIVYEKNGLVEGIEPFVLDRPEDVNIKLSLRRFIETLTLRDNLDVPLWGRLTFLTNGTRLVPNEYVAAIAQLLPPEDRKFYDQSRPWRHASVTDLTTMGLRPEDVTSSLYRYQNDSMAPVESVTEAPAGDAMAYGAEVDAVGDDPPTAVTTAIPRPSSEPPAREIEIRRRRFEKHFELVTLVQPPRRGKPYYARRLALLRDGHLLWSGTSFFTDGPWVVSVRDSAVLLALGLPD